MQALSMIDMGAKTPEFVAPAKPAEPQGKQFDKVLGEQRRPEPAEAKQQPAETRQQPAETGQQPAETKQTAHKQDVSTTTKSVEQPAQQPKQQQGAEKQAQVPAEVVAEAKPKLQQIVMKLMKTIAGGETPELTDESAVTKEVGSIDELLTQLVQQLEGAELEGEQVLAGIDLSVLVEQSQELNAEGGEEQMAQLVDQLGIQLEEQLVNEEGLLANAELAATMLPVTDSQATAPTLVENLAQARQILQKAIDSVTAQKAPEVVSGENLVMEDESAGQELLLDQETAEKIDPRFAGLLKPRSTTQQPQQSLRQQVQGNNAKMNQGQLSPVAENVQPMGEMKVEQSKVAEFTEQLANNPKQAFENLVQPAQGQAQPGVTAQAQSMTGKVTPEAPMVQLPSGQQVAESQIFDQVVARFSGRFNGESSRMVLRMQPAELGSLKLELMVEGDRVRANLQAQSLQVQEVLERNLPQLRNALAEQGLKIDEFRVDVDQEQNHQEQFEQMAQQQQQRQESQTRSQWQQPLETEEQIIPLAHLIQNGGGGISLHV